MKRFARVAACAAVFASTPGHAVDYIGGIAPVDDNATFTHLLVDQLKTRIGGSDTQFRYDGQLSFGSDTDELLIKSEGLVGGDGRFTDASTRFYTTIAPNSPRPSNSTRPCCP